MKGKRDSDTYWNLSPCRQNIVRRRKTCPRSHCHQMVRNATVLCPLQLRSGERGYKIDCNLAAASVFFKSIAMVIGPTPPGTGVIAEAISCTAS